MAGKGQHYLPRFLLKGFSSRTVNKESYVWVHRKGKISYESNIQRIAKESYFYGTKEDSDVDDKITKMETESFSTLIDELRSKNKISESKSQLIGDFVAHLIFRSKHTREITGQAAKLITDKAFEDLQNIAFLKKAIRQQRNQIIDDVKKDLKSRDIVNVENAQLEPFLDLYIEWFISNDRNLSEFSTNIKQVSDIVRQKLPTMGKKSQLKSFSKPLDSSERVRMYRNLHWSMITVEKAGAFILGDVGPIVIYGEDKEFNMALANKNTHQTIFLPISDKQLIVGRTEENRTLPDIEAINIGMAELSYEFFISSKNEQREIEYLRSIGKRNMDVVHDAIAGLTFDDYFDKQQVSQ